MNTAPDQTPPAQQPSDVNTAALQEVAVALCINTVCQAVMMASPNQLEAFAVGFFISEGLINDADEILAIDCAAEALGWQINITVLAACEHRIKARKRLMAGPSGCGLCGIDSLTTAMDTQGLVKQQPASGASIPSNTTIEQAKLGLEHRQKQQGYIRGHHSAALFNSIGDVITSSEDVGRHSALDKLIGEAVLQRQSLDNVFAMVTSRCSHDLIIKCRRAGIPCLVTLAPPTNLAVQSSVQVGLTLFCYQQSALKRFA